MSDHKIFSSSLSNDSWVRFEFIDIGSDFFPDMLEYTSGPCKVNPCEIRMLENNISSNRSIHVDQVDHSVRNACFFENLHQHIGRINLSIGRFPNDGITHHRSRSWKVTRDGSEVERSQCENETF